jgi:aminomethyltransferase
VNLGYHVPEDKAGDYIGKAALEAQKEQIENGEYPFQHKLIGLKFAGEPVTDYAPDFWLISDPETGEECGYLTSPWYNPDLETNIGMGFVPADKLQAVSDTPLNDEIYEEELDLEFEVHLPAEYAATAGEPVFATVAKVPFKESVNPSAREQAKLHARNE